MLSHGAAVSEKKENKWMQEKRMRTKSKHELEAEKEEEKKSKKDLMG